MAKSKRDAAASGSRPLRCPSHLTCGSRRAPVRARGLPISIRLRSLVMSASGTSRRCAALQQFRQNPELEQTGMEHLSTISSPRRDRRASLCIAGSSMVNTRGSLPPSAPMIGASLLRDERRDATRMGWNSLRVGFDKRNAAHGSVLTHRDACPGRPGGGALHSAESSLPRQGH